MNGKIFKLDNTIKSKLNFSNSIEALEVSDESILKALEAYKELVQKQKNEIDELKLYKEREIDAFAIGDAIADGICLTDKEGVVLAVNKVYLELTGLKEKDILGKNIRALIEKGYTKRVVSLMTLEQKKTVTILSTISTNNKKVLITGNPFYNEKGEITQVLTVMRDMTELIKLKEQLEKVEKESEKYLNELNLFQKQRNE